MWKRNLEKEMVKESFLEMERVGGMKICRKIEMMDMIFGEREISRKKFEENCREIKGGRDILGKRRHMRNFQGVIGGHQDMNTQP